MADAPKESTCILVWRRIFYVLNLGMPVFLAYTGARGLTELTGTTYNPDATSVVFQSIYMLVFAALLFVFEATQIYPCERWDNIMKRNFGFLYGPFGKGAYTLMIGIFAFGLAAPRELAIACGVTLAAYGPACILLSLLIPNLFEKKEKYVP